MSFQPTDEQLEIQSRARELAQTVIAPRAAEDQSVDMAVLDWRDVKRLTHEEHLFLPERGWHLAATCSVNVAVGVGGRGRGRRRTDVVVDEVIKEFGDCGVFRHGEMRVC